jgi:hypothetical protein
MSSLPIDAGVSFLLSHQHADGLWRDYQLEPGRSEAWTTACIGYVLLEVSGRSAEVGRAADALLNSKRAAGWGFNSLTACDADSTSWVVRFLSALGALGDIEAADLLSPYIGSSGRVRTFASVERFGSWAAEHDEVAPVVGLALLAAGEGGLAGCIRKGILSTPAWHPFWWGCYSYVCAQSLEFLSASGGIPELVRRRETAVLASLPCPSSVFDRAQRLLACSHLGACSAKELVERQHSDGGWLSSPELLVPSQRDGVATHGYADDRRLMSTAMSVLALKRVADAPLVQS